MHGRAKVRSGGVPSKIQHCVSAWTGIVLFFERRTDSVLFFERRVLRAVFASNNT